MRDLPTDTILADVETNVGHGVANVSAISEDFFRYGAGPGTWSNPDALKDLLQRIGAVSGLGLIQVDHANVASVAEFGDSDLDQVHRLLTRDRRHEFVWVNLGVETPSGELLAANGGLGKIRPFRVDDWGELCHEQVTRLARAGFFPMVSLILGLPGETHEHVEQALQWVGKLRNERVAVFPLFHAPLDGKARRFTVEDMTSLRWRLVKACYRLNFKWMPRLIWDNQAGVGRSWWRRMALQAMGKGQAVLWKSLLALRSARATA